MAITTLTVNEVNNLNVFSSEISPIVTAVDSTDKKAQFNMSAADQKYLILVQNNGSAAATVTFKTGNGIQGVADLSKSIGAGKYVFLQIESGRFKNVTGDNKGKVIIEGSTTDIKVGVFKLP